MQSYRICGKVFSGVAHKITLLLKQVATGSLHAVLRNRSMPLRAYFELVNQHIELSHMGKTSPIFLASDLHCYDNPGAEDEQSDHLIANLVWFIL
jgi:hypothetical protein